jgi:hypothetical protein
MSHEMIDTVCESRQGLSGIVSRGEVREVGKLKDFGLLLSSDEKLLTWWKIGMGFIERGA